MGKDERVELIRNIQDLRQSRLLTLVLSDRTNAPPVIIADDVIKPFFTQLNGLGESQQLDLFLYTRGGAMMTAYRLVKLLRMYSGRLSVLVPWKAHSAGTQICLGADEVIMSKLGELSPVDPSTTNTFNPVDRQGRPIPISVEDVTSYVNLANSKIGLKSEESKLEVFKTLVTSPNIQTHPLSLGNVNRVYDEIRLIVQNLLSIHMNPASEKDGIEKIKHYLTEVYTHDYLITRDEARTLGMKVKDSDNPLEDLMMNLYEDYENELQLQTPFDPESALGAAPSISLPLTLGYIESEKMSFAFKTEAAISRLQLNVMQVQQVPAISPAPVGPPPQTMVKFKPGRWELV